MSENILTIREVADLLKINEKTVYKLAAAAKIPGMKVGGSWRFDRATITLWLKNQSAADIAANDGADGAPEPSAETTLPNAHYSPQQGTFFAHRITLEGTGEDALAQSLSTARVDMNPHQVDAALFALASPLSKGVLLADEVGLGKTIEASLVIAQRWAERKRRILLVVPASLRKQWSQELYDKFSLPSVIVERKSYNDLRKKGIAKPFTHPDHVVITSYEFAALKDNEIRSGQWDLVVFDEAHRLRNVYRKDGAARAKKLRDATRPFFKILLTATPLQNSLMELYGLVSVLDEHHFGDEDSFRSQYVVGAGARNGHIFLRKRLEPICKRTLRRQVQQAGLIRYTERSPLTMEYAPSQDELKLYADVSAYLQRKDTIAFGNKPNQLVTMVVRKILGSSTFAIADTLKKIIDRLKQMETPTVETVADYDVIDEEAEEFDDNGNGEAQDALPIDPEKLKAEISELEGYRKLALSIGQNEKGNALIKALPQVLAEIVKKGGQRKAVIFTESVRTQTYLVALLAEKGYADDIVLLNGSNADPQSKSIYQNWLAQNKGTDAVSGSKTADMKAAIVEAFRDRKTILIATESGAEGINLQFCSLLVNFDLPWNPQRVEQRIGRCHRYGQKIDVTVVNFLNLKNHAEQRIHQLLDQKFNLFKGVFGASDEVLGVIERGVDIERRIFQIVQSARTETEIDAAFDKLQDDLKAQIDEQILDARKRLLESVDERVIDRLKTRKDEIRNQLSDFEKQLLYVARAEIPEARFHANDERRFDYRGETYTTEWPLADEKGWRFFRLMEGTLATDVVKKAKERRFDAASCLRFDLSSYRGGRLTDVEPLRGKAGWARIGKFSIVTKAITREHLVMAAVTDDGEAIHPETFERLFRVPAQNEPPVGTPPEDALQGCEAVRRKELLDEAEKQNAEWLDVESENLDHYAEDLERAFETEIKTVEAEVKEAKKAMRGSILPMAEKLAEKKRINGLEAKRDKLKREFFDRREKIREEVEAMLDKIQASLLLDPSLAPLFTIRWEVT
ncbi:TPA: helix-turn-helix domain-containing protein [Burkholderia cenocepacia]|uniref:SNF2-related protein n=1 Tax=Burkholderia cenocepacia TaxID=95486 RepID=UPI001B96F5CC|nr:SNF2-related protein [Burkholderia cenocepacia]MBR8098238.1 helix-turn-helix domain-containing protein [Burkholderia cenocepacia]HEP6426256.1 helix-turn-helix domain-containing protein [Burkholderia cenocepacia]